MTLRLAAMIPLLALTAGAHHPFSEIYDASNTATLTGTVVRLEWINPHVVLVMDVANPDGSSQRWVVEGYPPNAATRNAAALGWTRDSFRQGMRITVTGWPARDVSAHALSGGEVRFEDGSKGFFGGRPNRWSCAGPCPDSLAALLEHAK
jgi:hypothetical protein